MRRATIVAVCLLAVACSADGDPGAAPSTATSGDVAEPGAEADTGDTDDTVDTGNTGDTGDTVDTGNTDPAVEESDVIGGSVDAVPPARDIDDHVDLPGLVDASSEQIPDDEAVRSGRLENGLRYYVRENDNPGAKADLRLAVRAGSVDEFEPPTGVAHFLEHMLFNGTERFPENELIGVLRSFGASFGPDINAYTSFDETVYSLVVPADDEAVGLGLDVLAEWLSAATIAESDVVAERGVVLDEWRIRTQSADGRLSDLATEMYLGGTPYEGRVPIGSAASIEAMSDGDLRPFYDSWYRPDNVAVIVVGDIDADEIEAEIADRFTGVVPRTESMPGRPDTTFAVDTEPDFGLHSDPDQTTVDVEVTLPLPAYDGDGTATDRAALIDLMVYDIMVKRLRQDITAGVAPFDQIGPGTNSFVSGLDAPALYAFTDAARVDDTLDALLDEYVRSFRFGFSELELETARAALRSVFETRYDGRDSTQDRDYADAYVENFLRGTPYPSISDEYEVAVEIIDGITTEALGERFAARWSNSAPHVIISTPESQAHLMPDRADVLAAIEAAPTRDSRPRDVPRDLPRELMERPAPIEPASAETMLDIGLPFLDPIELEYPNGVRVRLNPNEIVEGRVFFLAGSSGGSSRVADADVPDALYAADIVTSSGVAGFNESELVQILAGSDVQVGASLTPYEERLYGASSTNDVETLLQLINLYMTEPRVDRVALDQVVAAQGPVVADPSIDPGAAGTDALLDTRYLDEPRYTLIPTPEQFGTVDLAGVERVWNDRYGDAGDWVFVFSGDFAMDDLSELASSYLATLPATGRADRWIDVSVAPPSAAESVDVTAGTGDTATVTFLFTDEIEQVTPLHRAQADVTTAVLRARLADVVREEFGETYSPYADSYVDADPDPVVETYVEISGAPTRLDQIADLLLAELDDLATNGPSQAEFAAATAEVEEAYNFVGNNQLLDVLLDDAIVPSMPLSGYLGQYGALLTITPADVQGYIADHIPVDRYVEVSVRPR